MPNFHRHERSRSTRLRLGLEFDLVGKPCLAPALAVTLNHADETTALLWATVTLPMATSKAANGVQVPWRL
jgi:hypothetical protein